MKIERFRVNRTWNINSNLNEDAAPMLRLWVLRALVLLGGYKKFVETLDFEDRNLASFLDLSVSSNQHGGKIEFSIQCEIGALADRLQLAEESADCIKFPQNLASNIEALSALTGLTEIDKLLLGFVVMLKGEKALQVATDYLGEMTTSHMVSVVATILDQPRELISAALNKQSSPLLRCGLLSIDPDPEYCLAKKLDLMSDRLVDALYLHPDDGNPTELLDRFFAVAKPAELSLAAFDHAKSDLNIITKHLQHSLENHSSGTNYLIYGLPGVGKTQLARAVGESLGCSVYELSLMDDDGDVLDANDRLKALRIALHVLAQNSRALLIVDDCDDLITSGITGYFSKSLMSRSKGFFNNLLEENSVPVIWLANNVSELDPAAVRRFSIPFELGMPPKDQRLSLLKSIAGDYLSADLLETATQSTDMTQAVFKQVVSVIQSLGIDDQQARDDTFVQLANNVLKAQRNNLLKIKESCHLPTCYDPTLLNMDAPALPQQLARNLIEVGSVKLLLTGPSGCGKTAFAHWIAGEMKRSVTELHISDLLSKYLGGTEKRIAQAFHQAASQDSVLLLNEFDSLASSRKLAHRNWEVTQVNELLTQMERFEGVLIATSNLMDRLDNALARRFDTKIQFDYLTPTQGWELLHRYCDMLNLGTPDINDYMDRFMLIQHLTPGDFNTVARGNRFCPLQSPREFIVALEKECRLKSEFYND